MSYGLANSWGMQTLGWTLLHFLWQGALVALVLGCMLALMRGQRSQLRYAAACCGLALMVALPVVTFAHLAPAARWASLQRAVLRFELDTTVTVVAGRLCRRRRTGWSAHWMTSLPGFRRYGWAAWCCS